MKRKITFMAIIIASLLVMQLPIAVFADDSIETMPGVGNPSEIFADNAPAVWVGGNFIADNGFAESEGLNVIQKNMIVQNNQLLSVGVAGVGSGIVPTPDSVMLAVGGNLTVAPLPSEVKIGAPLIHAGIISAIAWIGGEVSGEVKAVHSDELEDTRNIHVGLGATATSLWSNFETELKKESEKLAQMVTTGTVTSLWDVARFESIDTGAPIQVFEISAEDLATFSSWGGFEFWGIPRLDNDWFAPIVINVIGESATLYQNDVRINGEDRVDAFDSPDFGNAASAILWNFVDAEYLEITGSSQVMGSIIAPYTESVNITASTNGRLFVNGDLTRSGEGTEHHNYPWTGGEWYFARVLEPLGDPESTEEPEEPGVPEEPEESSVPEEPEESGEPEGSEELGEPGESEGSEELDEPGESEGSEELGESGESEGSEELGESGESEGSEELDESEGSEGLGESGESEGSEELGEPGESEGSEELGEPGESDDPVDSRTGSSAGSVVTDDPDDPDSLDGLGTEHHTGSIVTDGTYGSDNPSDPVDSRTGYYTGMSVISNPDDPDDLEDLSDIDEPTTGYHIPNTSDNSSITRWLIVMCCSAVICIPCFLLSRKSNNSSSYTK